MTTKMHCNSWDGIKFVVARREKMWACKKINCLVIVEKKNEQNKRESVNNQEKDSLKKTCKKECMNFKKDTWNKERMKDAISKNWLNF